MFFIFCQHCTWTSARIQAELHIWTRCLRLANLSLCGETLFFKHIFSYIDFIYQNFLCKLTWTSKLYDYLLVALLWNTTRAPPAIIYQNFCSNLTWTSQCMFFIFVLACTLHGIHDQHNTCSHIYQDFCSKLTWTSQCMFFMFCSCLHFHAIHHQHITSSHNIPGLLQ